MNVGEIITDSEIIAAVKMRLRKQYTTEFDDYFSLLIAEGARHLGTLSLFTKRECELDIIDNKSQLPKGFYRMIGLRFPNVETESPDNGGSLLTVNCAPLIYVDTPFLNFCGCETNSSNVIPYTGTFQINGNHIHYNSTVTATSATLSYLGFNLDKSGRITLYADYERALTAYCCYNFTVSYSDEYKEATIERYRQEWVAQKSWIKGLDASNDFQQRKREVQSIFNALVVSPIVNNT